MRNQVLICPIPRPGHTERYGAAGTSKVTAFDIAGASLSPWSVSRRTRMTCHYACRGFGCHGPAGDRRRNSAGGREIGDEITEVDRRRGKWSHQGGADETVRIATAIGSRSQISG